VHAKRATMATAAGKRGRRLDVTGMGEQTRSSINGKVCIILHSMRETKSGDVKKEGSAEGGVTCYLSRHLNMFSLLCYITCLPHHLT